jgi:acetoacetate decarboxylase
VERVEGKLELRELASDPVVDLPIVETESIVWSVRTSTTDPKIVRAVDAAAFEPYAYSRYDMAR